MNIQIMMNTLEIAHELPIANLEVLQILVDSQRHRLVSLLIQEPLSARELAERLGLARTRLYYHLELLQRHGIVRVVETRVVAGLEERRYRAVARGFRVDRKLLAGQASEPQIADRQAAILEAVAGDLRARALTGTERPGEDDDVLVGRKFLTLSDARRQELRARLGALLAEYEANDAGGRPTEVAFALFATERDAQ